jgi:hypothetical protein
MRTIFIFVAVAVFSLSLSAVCAGQTNVWYINDGPDVTYHWEDTSIGSFWEWMYPTAIDPGDSLCTISDLPSPYMPQSPLFAVSYPENAIYSGCEFYAVLYLENNYPGFSEPVTVTLGTGTAGIPASFVPIATPVTVYVTNSGTFACGLPYTFNFGTVASCVLTGNSLILQITNNDTGGNTHIFWDSWCCPSALYANCPATGAENRSWGAIKSLYRD